MKRFHDLLARLALAGLLSATAARAEWTFETNFNDDISAGSEVYGTAVVEWIDDDGEDGVLQLTVAEASQNGSWIVDDFSEGQTIGEFEASFRMLMGGNASDHPADGMSFSFGRNIPDNVFSPAEEGAGDGLRVAFDSWDSGGGEAPAIEIFIGGNSRAIAHFEGSRRLAEADAYVIDPETDEPADLFTGDEFVDVNVSLKEGKLNLEYKGLKIFTDLELDFKPVAGARFAFGARTGGANNNHWIDDVAITTFAVQKPVLSGFQPGEGAVVTPNSPVVVVLSAGLSPLDTGSIKLTLNGEAAPVQVTEDGVVLTLTHAPEGGLAPDTAYTAAITASDDAGAKLEFGWEFSTSALVTIGEADLVFDFDDGEVPDGTEVYGTAIVDFAGGVEDSGTLILTEATQSQQGSFVIEDFNEGANINGIGVAMKLRIGGPGEDLGGSPNPADGFSFNFAPDVPDGTWLSEEGAGSGISVCIDTWDNGAGEAPAVDLKFGGALVASEKMPKADLLTGTEFTDLIVRVETDGTVDVVYNDMLVFDNVQTEFTGFANGKIGLAARTGGAFSVHAVDDLRIAVTRPPSPVISSLSPADGSEVLSDARIVVEIANGIAEVDAKTVQLTLNGEPVTPEVEAAGRKVTLTYSAPDGLKPDAGQAVAVAFKDTDGNEITGAWAFRTAPLIEITDVERVIDFNDGMEPDDSYIYGTAYAEEFGGMEDSGVMTLTMNVNNEAGAFILEDQDEGDWINAFALAFKLRISGPGEALEGSGNPADGFSVSLAQDLPDDVWAEAENGAGSGLRFCFDTYDNGGGEAPSIDIRFGTQLVATALLDKKQILTGLDFVDVLIRVEPDGTADVAFNGLLVHHDVQTPFTGIVGGLYGFAARTGGQNAIHAIDDLRMASSRATRPLLLSRSPQPGSEAVYPTKPVEIVVADTLTALDTDSVRLSINGTKVAADVSHEDGFTTIIHAPANGLAELLPHEVTLSFTDDDGARQEDTWSFTTTDRIVMPEDHFHYDFNTPKPPKGSRLSGHASLSEFEGIDDSGYLMLTDALNSQSGSWIIGSPLGKTEVFGFIANFQVRIGGPGVDLGGTDSPADGLSFNFADDIPPRTWQGEEGVGSGIRVCIDTWNNGGGEAPAIDLKFGDNILASKKVPKADLLTGLDFADMTVRLQNDGTVDVMFKDEIVFWDVATPSTSYEKSRFGFGARTGGANAVHGIDDLRLALITEPPPADEPPTVSIVRNGSGNLIIEWTGILQTAENVNGPWVDVDATSPFILKPETLAKQQYARSRLP
ncbi:MAG: Ig-like domain-containing protein [Verrucomicrobia bacterium]|nr:Ig-like domain-containing protein [Verrucomicrobiota bacterium]